MLYSLNAMTTYGHESVSLEEPWQMMGAPEVGVQFPERPVAKTPVPSLSVRMGSLSPLT